MLFRKSYFFIVFIFNLSLVSFHFLKNLNFSGTTSYPLLYSKTILNLLDEGRIRSLKSS
ncbi:hypothetical protein LEP1GSC080_2827 [Leptospira interrogans str. FPW2026]|nr:hypothetical protein LEP1GSC080_2827 [Leptospira interrogans str. FPW2026]EMN82525.1 hypothetical protein LEP1GSC106_0424 [Leptospira interrogans serovar Grippotyphosa str. UI 12764]